jgi:hypothetical protein
LIGVPFPGVIIVQQLEVQFKYIYRSSSVRRTTTFQEESSERERERDEETRTNKKKKRPPKQIFAKLLLSLETVWFSVKFFALPAK